MVPILRGKGGDIALDRGTALSDDYVTPDFHISAWQAIGHRLRRNYLWIFSIQYAAYLAKIWMHPIEAASVSQALERAHVGAIPGWLAVICGTLLQVMFIAITLIAWRKEKADKTRMSDYLEEPIEAA